MTAVLPTPAADPAGGEAVIAAAADLAVRLVAAVRAPRPDRQHIAVLLADAPDGRTDVLALVLAAMVDPDRDPAELLAWTDRLWFPHGFDAGYVRHRRNGTAPCRDCRVAHSGLTRMPKTGRDEFVRLRLAGVDVDTALTLAAAA